tara:strand:+ start:249 stop:782 length:534 start_codon:yes stop_codon:yes gene_type:complete
MKFIKTNLSGLYVLENEVFKDKRGFFLETFRSEIYTRKKINVNFVQENHSRSKKNTLRGLHFQKNKPQCQLVTVIRGKIYDVVVDIRKQSKTYGKWFGTYLSDKGIRQIYMSEGFAHGYCVLSDYADLHYKVTETYNPINECGLNYKDPHININWPVKKPIIKKRDKDFPFFEELKL